MSMYVIWSNKAAKLRDLYSARFGGYRYVPDVLKNKVTSLCNVANKCWSYERS